MLKAQNVAPLARAIRVARTRLQVIGFQAVVTPYFFFAHLFFCAAAILARPAVLIVLRFLGGNPPLSGAVWSVSSALTFSRRLISASIFCTISSVFIV
jgi:hypothetical protein